MMLYIILGSAIVLSVLAEVVGQIFFGLHGTSGPPQPAWLESGFILVALGLGVRRWPGDWSALVCFTVALLIEVNQRLMPGLAWSRRVIVGGMGAYVMTYGWGHRGVDRGERKGLLVFGAWFAVVVGGGCILYALGVW
jgi:hypothetical protein